MKLKYLAIAALAAVMLFAGCASKPPAVDEPVIDEPVVQQVQISQADLTGLHERVLAARKDAFDLGAKEFFPEDYAAADARYAAGKSALDADGREVAKAELEAALPLFQALAERSLGLSAEKGKENTAAARDRAIASDAQLRSPDAFDAAEALNEQADAALAAGKTREAAELYRKAIFAYDAAEKRSRALVVKEDIDWYDYARHDTGNYALAGEKLALADGLIASDPEAANDANAEALLRYNLVLKKGWELNAGGLRTVAEGYKKDSEGIKAQVAVRDEYAQANAVWNDAARAYAAEDYEEASGLFAEAEELFKSVYEVALSKRANAEAAIKAAAEQADRSGAIAAEGDLIIGGDTGSGAGNQ
jgi:tetratricopeptide (TPR) repeat protein